MLSSQLVERLEAFNKEIESLVDQPLLRFLSSLKETKDDYATEFIPQELLSILDNNGNNGIMVIDKLKKHRETFVRIAAQMRLIKPRPIFTGIGEIHDILTLFQNDIGELYSGSIQRRLFEFEEAYERFIESSYPSIFKLVDTGTELYNTLFRIIGAFELIIRSLKIQHEDDELLKPLSIFLDSEHTFAEFLKKLEAIKEIYSELCNLLNISESSFPLRILKIETGSINIDILGAKEAIEVFSNLIKGAANYFYRTRTIEGKIASTSRKIEAIEAEINLREKLQAIGIPVNELDERIQKAAILIADDLNCLLEGESKVKLNGQILLEDNSETQKYLPGSKQHLLGPAKDSTEGAESNLIL